MKTLLSTATVAAVFFFATASWGQEAVPEGGKKPPDLEVGKGTASGAPASAEASAGRPTSTATDHKVGEKGSARAEAKAEARIDNRTNVNKYIRVVRGRVQRIEVPAWKQPPSADENAQAVWHQVPADLARKGDIRKETQQVIEEARLNRRHVASYVMLAIVTAIVIFTLFIVAGISRSEDR